MIKGITVTLYEKTAAGTDAFNHTIYTTNPVQVNNVLVGNPTGTDVIAEINLTGKKQTWVFGIPKGDTHNWLDSDVEFDLAGHHKAHTYGPYTEGIEAMIPLAWHKQITCEEYG